MNEKFVLNSQRDKAKLLKDLESRLVLIFSNKNIELTPIYSIINILLNLAFNPINAPINVELIRENFESRDFIVKRINYEQNKINLSSFYLMNQNNNQDLNEWKYMLEESSEDEEDLEKEDEIIKEIEKLEVKVKIDDSHSIEQKRKIQIADSKIQDKNLHLIYLQMLFPSIFDQKNEVVYLSLLNSNSRFTNKNHHKFSIKVESLIKNGFLFQNSSFNKFLLQIPDPKYIGLDFLSMSILLSMKHKEGTIISKEIPLEKLSIIESSNNVIRSIFDEINIYVEKIEFLRNLEKFFSESNLKLCILEAKKSFVDSYLKFFDYTISYLIKKLNYQLGKTTHSQFIRDKESSFFLFKESYKENILIQYLIEINNSLLLSNENVNFSELNLILQHSFYCHIDFLVNVVKEINLCSKLFSKNNEISTEFINIIYNLVKGESELSEKKGQLFYIIFFFEIVNPYLETLFNFINQGNLIDLNGEFFIDHAITYKNKSNKLIFNFDKNFVNHPWKQSFGIIKWSNNDNLNLQNKPCVPEFFLAKNISIKVLECGKISFILSHIKNLSKINFFQGKKQDNELKISTFSEIKKNIKDFIEKEILKLRGKEDKFEINYQEDSKKSTFFELFMNDEIIKSRKVKRTINEDALRINLSMMKEKNDLPFSSDFTLNRFFALKFSYLNVSSKKIPESENQDKSNSMIIDKKYNEQDLIQRNLCLLEKFIVSDEINESFDSFQIKSFQNIIDSLIINEIFQVNITLNKKIMDYFFNRESLTKHFDFTFKFYLLENSYSFIKFLTELFDSKKIVIDNIFLRNKMEEISDNIEFKQFSKNFSYANLNVEEKLCQKFLKIISDEKIFSENIFLEFHYVPEWPIVIFFDSDVTKIFNRIFNIFLKIKRFSCLIINSNLDKRIKFFMKNIKNIEIIRCFRRYICLKSLIIEIINSVEYYIYHVVTEKRLQNYRKNIHKIISMNDLINSYSDLGKDILKTIIINEKFKASLDEIFLYINKFLILSESFLSIDISGQEEEIEAQINKISLIDNEIVMIIKILEENYFKYRIILDNSNEFKKVI